MSYREKCEKLYIEHKAMIQLLKYIRDKDINFDSNEDLINDMIKIKYLVDKTLKEINNR